MKYEKDDFWKRIFQTKAPFDSILLQVCSKLALSTLLYSQRSRKNWLPFRFHRNCRALLSNAEAGWICSRKASAGLERFVGEMQLSSDWGVSMKTLPGLSLLQLFNKSELFQTSQRYSEPALGNAGKTSVEMFYGCACSGGQKKVHIRCIGREARLPGGTRPRMAQGHHQPSTTTFLDPFPPHFISLSSSLYFSVLLTLFLFPPCFSFAWPWPSFWFCVDGWRGNNWQGRVRKVKIAVEDNGWAKNKQWSAALNFVFV